jgi:hypothetical protein
MSRWVGAAVQASRFRSGLALLTYFCGFETIAAALRLFFA